MTGNKRLLDLEEELDYYKTKCASLENGLISMGRDKAKLEKENEQLKQQLTSILKLIKKIEDYTHDIKMIGDDLND